MPTIIKKIKKGKAYYYAAQSERVDGKPRIVWQKYLGTVSSLLQHAEQTQPTSPKETIIFEAGGVAALLRIARRLGLLELINQVVKKRQQGASVGHYILLAAINRALSPCSKLAIGDWYQQTVLRRLWGFNPGTFSSQRFWDQMGMVNEKEIELIQDRLVAKIKAQFGLDLSLLLYDTTNFFTFLATGNQRAQLPQRGHSKQKRHDLRQVGLALLVTRDFQIPLLHRVYDGNIPDVSLFQQNSRELIAHYAKLNQTGGDVTLVFDKGNVSQGVMENLVIEKVHFVAAVSQNRIPELFTLPNQDFGTIPGMPGNKALSFDFEMWGGKLLGVMVYSESFFTQQLSGVTENLVKCQKKLADLEQRLLKWRKDKVRGKPPTMQVVQRSVQEILSPQFMNFLIAVKVEEENGLPRLRYEVNHSALQRLCDERLGKTLLVSDRLDWTDQQVVEAYRSLSQVEDAFRNMKNVEFLRWQPAYHWTDQKLRVHAFYCVLALLLCNLARQEVVQSGIEISLPGLLKELSSIREVAVVYPAGSLAHRKDHLTLSRMSPRQKKLVKILRVEEILKG